MRKIGRGKMGETFWFDEKILPTNFFRPFPPPSILRFKTIPCHVFGPPYFRCQVALSHLKEEGAMGTARATFRRDSVLPPSDILPNGTMSIGNLPRGASTQGSHQGAPSGAMVGRRPLAVPPNHD